jgi:hypothetical protein
MMKLSCIAVSHPLLLCLVVFFFFSKSCDGHVLASDANLDESKIEEHWHYHTAVLPKPISDHSATLVPDTGRIYIMGGCNSTNGNTRAVPNDTTADFFCPEVSDHTYIFDTNTGGGIITLPPAPHPRYRHGAVYHNGLLWFLGGRDASYNESAGVDSLVYEVDVLDTTTNRWRTDLTFALDPTIMARSDHAAFVIDDTIYLAGGYLLGYNATATTIAIDIPLSLKSGKILSWNQRADMNQERGDCHAAVVNGVAYVIGGFTHTDNWCAARNDVETYRPNDDAWSRLSAAQSLTYGRGDKAVVTVGTRLYVIGGESKTDCEGDPGQRTSPTTEVEVFETADGDAASWTEEIADIPNDHFRFPAVSYNGVIYAFGGQNYYNADCDCFPTSNVILTFDTTAEPAVDTTSGSIAAPAMMTMVAMVLPAVAALWALF